MKDNVSKIAGELKNLIDVKGPEYIFNEPAATYRHLSDVCDKDAQTCRAILCVLVSEILQESEDRSNAELLSKMIQNECCFNSKMADRLAEIFSRLYSEENEVEWKNRELHGLKEFLNNEFRCEWEGFAVWKASNGSVSCHYSANIELSISNEKIVVKEIASLIDANPFVTREEICEYYREKLTDYLDEIFVDYCTCEPLYEPVVEDFFVEDYTKDWCSENGIEIVSCEGDGYDDGYEPDFFVGGWNY